MKRQITIIITLAFLAIILAGCKKQKPDIPTKSLNNKEKWIGQRAGIELFSKPDENASTHGYIQYGEQINLLEEHIEPTTISNLTGKWTKVRWYALEGWIFLIDGYLLTYEPSDKPVKKKYEPKKSLNPHERYLIGNWYYSIDGIVENQVYTFRGDRTITFDSYLGGAPTKVEGKWECDNDGNIIIYGEVMDYKYEIVRSNENKMTLEHYFYFSDEQSELVTVIMTRKKSGP